MLEERFDTEHAKFEYFRHWTSKNYAYFGRLPRNNPSLPCSTINGSTVCYAISIPSHSLLLLCPLQLCSPPVILSSCYPFFSFAFISFLSIFIFSFTVRLCLSSKLVIFCQNINSILFNGSYFSEWLMKFVYYVIYFLFCSVNIFQNFYHLILSWLRNSSNFMIYQIRIKDSSRNVYIFQKKILFKQKCKLLFIYFCHLFCWTRCRWPNIRPFSPRFHPLFKKFTTILQCHFLFWHATFSLILAIHFLELNFVKLCVNVLPAISP